MRGIILIGLLFLVGCSSPEERFAEKIQQANVNLEKGDVQKAIKLLEKLKAEYPDQPQVLENLAFAFVKAEEYFTGAFYFNQLAHNFPENSNFYLYSAQAWVNAGDVDSAIRDYETYLLDNKTDWNTWKKIGDLYLQSDQKSKAIHAYSQSSQIRFNPQLDLKGALLANESGNLRQAEDGFERLLMVEDSAIAKQAHIGLLQIKHKRRQWDEVEKLMTEIEERFPLALSLPEVEKVKTDYETFNQAKIAEIQKIKEEEDRRNRMIEQQRERAEQLAAARLAQLSQSENPHQEEILPSALAREEAVEPEPIQKEISPPPPVVEKPKKKSSFDLALESARQVGSTNSETTVARYWDAINAGDETGIAFHELSRVYYSRGEFGEAEMTALEALRRNSNSNRYLLTYLNIIRKTKPKPEVVKEIRKYRQLFPQNADLVLLLARIYAEPGGDATAARGLYEQFFKIAPNHPETDRARYEVRGL